MNDLHKMHMKFNSMIGKRKFYIKCYREKTFYIKSYGG